MNRLHAALVLPLAAAALLAPLAGPAHAAASWSHTPSTLFFDAEPGGTSSQTATYTNTGDATDSLEGVALVGDAASSYSVAHDCTAVAPRASCSVTVTFTPDSYGRTQAELRVSAAGGTDSIGLAGTGGRVPGAIRAAVAEIAPRRVVLHWEAPADLGSPADVTYRVTSYYDFSPHVTTTTATSLSDVLPAGGQRTYVVVAVNAAGTGPEAYLEARDRPHSVLFASDGPGVESGLYFAAFRTGYKIPFLADSRPRSTPSVSPDGTQVAFAQAESSTAEADLWVAPVDGSTAPRQVTSLAGDEYEPSWSTDGRTLAFTHETADALEVRTVPAAGGSTTLRYDGGSRPDWLVDNSTLVVEDDVRGGLLLVDAARRVTRVPGSDGGYSPSVNADGTRLVFVVDTASGRTTLATLPVRGGTPVVLQDTADWDSPSYGVTGTNVVYAERYDGSTPRLAAIGVNPDGYSTPTWAYPDVPGPQAVPVEVMHGIWFTDGPPPVTGRTATFDFQDTTGYSCTLDGAYDNRCSTHAVFDGLADGRHRVVLSGSSVEGNPASYAAWEWTVDGTVPVVTVTAPAAGTSSLATTAAVSYRATDAGGGVTFDVRYRTATPTTAYTAYTSPAAQVRTTRTTQSIGLVAGRETCVSVRARDAAGNTSAWSADRCVTAALDDRALAVSGSWTRPSLSGAYKGTVTSTTRAGTSLSLGRVQARRVTVYATRCATCGQVAVYVGSTRIGVVDTRGAAAKAVRYVLPLQPAVRSGTLSLKPLQAGRTVQVDGVALAKQ